MTLAILALSLTAAAAPARAAEPPVPLVCRLDALSETERARHRLLTERLASAVVRHAETADGYELTLDLTRLSKDARGEPFCVVEVAEWVDLEARCCPFLDFAIAVGGKGGPIRLRLSGGAGVKDFLKSEMPLK